MEFVDHTGHIFSLPEWNSYPTGYEYEIGDYVFWLESQSTKHKLSINNFYILPIRIILESENSEVEISIKESDHFRLLGSSYIQSLIEKNKNVFEEIDIDDNMFKTTLTSNDLVNISNVEIEGKENTCCMSTFYIIGFSQEEGSWMTNILIHEKTDTHNIYCPITVGGEFYMEIGELIANGHNMGIWLPKDILNSFYDMDVKNYVYDEAMMSLKLKELLLNYMHIKGECGNYESAKDSLKWFGYGDLISIRQLLQTDNQFLGQYVHDNFDVNSDNLWTWKNFRRSSAYSIWMNINKYMENEDKYNFNEELVGEGKPLTEDLFSKYVYETYDEEDIKFWKPFYNWKLDDMYIKMAMLEYYWKKYFLPIAFTLSSATMKQYCWMNDVKYIVKTSVSNTEVPTWIADNLTKVKFPSEDIIYLYNQKAYFDECYNEYTNSEVLGKTTDIETLYINDVCARIPIEFVSDKEETYYNVILILSREGTQIYSSSFNFYQDKLSSYKNFILIPKSLVRKYKKSYWINKKYRLSINCNGNWYYYDFQLKVPEFQLKVGTLQYKYFNYIEEKMLLPGDEGYQDPNDIDTSEMTEEEIANLNKMTYQKSLFTQIKSITDDSVNFNSYMYCPSLTEVNDVNFFDRLKYIIDYAELDSNSNSNKINISTNNGSTISVRNYCEYLASKCYIYGFGLEKTQKEYKKGNSVVPMFRFNNGIKLSDIKDYKLKRFDVEVLFDVDTNNDYYAKRTYNITELENINQPIIVNDLQSYNKINDKELIARKNELGIGSHLKYKMNGEIDWEATDTTWKKFYIDEHIRHKASMVVRFVTTGEIELPNGRIYKFGGYRKDGTPKVFKDIPIKIWSKSDTTVCTMECHCPWAKECKFREDNSASSGYDEPAKDDYIDESMKNEIMSDNIKTGLDMLISSFQQNIITTNNKKYLNRVHIYDIYLNKMNRKKANRLGLNISNITRLKYNSKIFNSEWDIKGFKQPQELVEMYRMFFNNDGTCKLDINDDYFIYDFYLMHDNANWFAVFISQSTEDSAIDNSQYNIDDEIKWKPENGTEFTLKRYRSSDRFLMNRMIVDYSYPKNHFNQDDLIFATIDNVKFPFILDKTTKWSVKNLSLLNKNKPSITSNSNAMILSLYDEASKNVSGYYNIDVRYSIEGNVDHQQKKHTKIFIEK